MIGKFKAILFIPKILKINYNEYEYARNIIQNCELFIYSSDT